MKNLLSALAFFTRIPVSASLLGGMGNLHGIMGWLPLIGVLVGGLSALAVGLTLCMLDMSGSVWPLLCGLAGCMMWAAVTGGLHLDGVADCGDGLLAETTIQRRLEIMKDSRLGTFGGMLLFFVLLMKILTLASITEALPWSENAFSALGQLMLKAMLAGCLGRALMLFALGMPSARPGLGSAVRENLSGKSVFFNTALVFLLVCFNGLPGLRALLLSGAVCALLLFFAHRRIGGVTGDVFGCIIEICECAVLLGL